VEKRTKLLVIEDNPLLREGIREMLKPYRDIVVLTPPARSGEILRKADRRKPDVILLDRGLRNLDSLEIVGILRKEYRTARIVVMDLAPVQGDILRFLQAGASGFILKDATLDIFVETIRAVSAGTKVVPPTLRDSVFSRIVEQAIKKGVPKLHRALKMTRREKDVIGLIGDGKTNLEIARSLRITTHTVKSHVHNIMEKLALHARLEVANRTGADRSLPRRIAGTVTVLDR